MCHRFTPLSADGADRVLDYLRAVERALDQGMSPEGALPSLAPGGVIALEAVDCYPGSTCSVIVAAQASGGASDLERRDMAWGVEVSWRKGLVFNARIESALRGEGMWREAMERGRCVVPVRAFYETRNGEAAQGEALEPAALGTSRVQEELAESAGSPAPVPAALAARPARRPQYRFAAAADQALLLAGLVLGDRFVVVTTEPNDVVGAVHNRMPLVLTAPEALGWLRGAGAAREWLGARSAVALTREEAPPTGVRARGGAGVRGGGGGRGREVPMDQLSLF